MRLVPLALFALLIAFTAWFGYSNIQTRGRLSSRAAPTPPPTTPAPLSVLDPVRGATTGARITIIEYGDFACEGCKAVEPVLRELLDGNADVNLAWRDFPIEAVNPFARRAALAARCAEDQKKFWDYHDALLARTDLLGDQVLLALARDLGLNEQRFAACLGAGERMQVVDRNVQEALSLGSRAAPDFFINGARYTGPLTRAGFEAAISAL